MKQEFIILKFLICNFENQRATPKPHRRGRGERGEAQKQEKSSPLGAELLSPARER
jgi:hypothetical protein